MEDRKFKRDYSAEHEQSTKTKFWIAIAAFAAFGIAILGFAAMVAYLNWDVILRNIA